MQKKCMKLESNQKDKTNEESINFFPFVDFQNRKLSFIMNRADFSISIEHFNSVL